MKQYGGKTYEASETLIEEKDAGYLPNFRGLNLYNQKVHTTDILKGKVSLVAFAYDYFAKDDIHTFIQPFLYTYRGHKDIQLVKVDMQEFFVQQCMARMLLTFIHNKIHDERKGNYLMILENISIIRKYLNMINPYIGYVFLIDQNCKIRWTANAAASDKEIKNMLKFVHVLKETS